MRCSLPMPGQQPAGPRAGWAKALLTQTWEYRIEAFPYPPRPYGSITVPLGPVQSVTSIAYTDNAGLALTLDPAAYTLSGDRISPVYGTNWPAARPGVTILFTAGYGDDWNSIPEAIRQGVAMLAAYWYSQRESVTVGPDQGPASRVPYDTKEMLAPFKSWLV